MAWFAAQGVPRSRLKTRALPTIRHGQAHLTLAAARAGQGIALSNRFLAADDLDAGRLTAVEGGAPFEPVAFGAYIFRYAISGRNPDATERFRSWLIRQVAP